MKIDDPAIANASSRHGGRRVIAISIAVALVVGGATTASAATAQATAESLARTQAAAGVVLEQKLVLHRAAAIEGIRPLGQVLVDDAMSWASSGSVLLTAAEGSALQSTADAMVESLGRTPTATVSSRELARVYDAQWAMILGARERMTPIVTAVVAAAKVQLDASPMADAASRQAVVDTNAALETSWQNHSSVSVGLTELTGAVTAVTASQSAAVVAQAAAAAAAAEAARVAAAAAASRGNGYHPSTKSGGAGGASVSGGSPGAGAVPTCSSDVLTCVNQIRAYNGLGALSSNGTLNQASQACADRMASSNSMTHSGATPGFGYWGENIAKGYGSAAAVFAGWMNSSGHRANILNPAYTKMGLGYVSGGNWWCQQFGS